MVRQPATIYISIKWRKLRVKVDKNNTDSLVGWKGFFKNNFFSKQCPYSCNSLDNEEEEVCHATCPMWHVVWNNGWTLICLVYFAFSVKRKKITYCFLSFYISPIPVTDSCNNLCTTRKCKIIGCNIGPDNPHTTSTVRIVMEFTTFP